MISNEYGIKGKPSTVRNPQTHAIVERIHQVKANIIRTFELDENYLDEEDPWKGILSAAAFAVWSTYHTTLKKTPGQLVFQRDIMFPIKHIANWEYIWQNMQKLIDKNNKAENAKCIQHVYKTGDQVLLKRGTEHKYKAPYQGPFRILKFNDNGTVCLQMGAVEDTINIRRLMPYFEPDDLHHGGKCSMPRRSNRLLDLQKQLTVV